MIKGKLLGFGLRQYKDKVTKEPKKMTFATVELGELTENIGVGREIVEVKAFNDLAQPFFDNLIKSGYLNEEVLIDCTDFGYLMNKSLICTLAAKPKF